MLAGRQAEKYSLKNMSWALLGISEPFDVYNGDVILVRVVGLKVQPGQLLLEVRVSSKFREAISRSVTSNLLHNPTLTFNCIKNIHRFFLLRRVTTKIYHEHLCASCRPLLPWVSQRLAICTVFIF